MVVVMPCRCYDTWLVYFSESVECAVLHVQGLEQVLGVLATSAALRGDDLADFSQQGPGPGPASRLGLGLGVGSMTLDSCGVIDVERLMSGGQG